MIDSINLLKLHCEALLLEINYKLSKSFYEDDLEGYDAILKRSSMLRDFIDKLIKEG